MDVEKESFEFSQWLQTGMSELRNQERLTIIDHEKINLGGGDAPL